MNEYLTAALPGTGGIIRQTAEDFEVEEIPLYQPCGEGEHLYLWVEKQGLSTFDLLNSLAAALNCRERDLGYAGLKDTRALTRQMISVPLIKPEQALALEIPGVKILSAAYHRNKLRPGHLAGNRFRIRIQQPGPDAADRAEAILGVLSDLGVPNRFGNQRYGALGNTHRIGHLILLGDFAGALREIIGDPDLIEHPGWQQAARAFRDDDLQEAIARLPRHCQNERRLLSRIQAGAEVSEAILALPRKLLRLYLSAYQSSLFDRMVAMRLSSLEKIWPGDLAYKHVNGACFLVQDADTEQVRADRFEISSSAPLFGCKVSLAEGQAGLLERSLLESEGLQLNDFRLGKGLTMDGERRPIRVPITGSEVRMENEALQVGFSLPRGSYATTVLEEIIKPAPQPQNLAGGLH